MFWDTLTKAFSLHLKLWRSFFISFNACALLILLALTACSGSPSEIGTDFYPGIILAPSGSLILLSNAQVATGSSITVTLFLKDTQGNPFVSTLPNVALRTSGGTSTGTFGPLINNGDGSYSALFSGITIGTAIVISPVVDGASVVGTFPSVTVISSSAAPTALTYSNNPATYVKGTAITANNPTHAGGAVTGYSVSPALASGLSLDAASGIITGTATAYSASASYTITASNGGGSTTASLTLQVNDVPLLSYAAATGTAGTVGTAMTVTPTTLSSQGTALTGCAIKTATTALPAWATLNTSTCVITGTPTSALSSTSYTINATNSVGTSTDATVSLSAVYPDPTLTSITPSSGTRNGGTSVTIAGTNFYSGLTVTLGGNACTSIVVTSTTQITCTTPAHTIGNVDVIVTNSGTTSATLTSGYNFTSTAYTETWDFNTASDYTYDHSKIEFTGGVGRLIASQQTDNSSSCSTGFGDGITSSCGGTPIGTVWSSASDGLGSSNYTMLSQTGTANDQELSANWAPAWPDLAAYWKLNGTVGAIAANATIPDSSPLGTASGTMNLTGTSYVSGKLNQGILFTTGGQYIIVPAAAAPSPCHTMTMGFWLNSTATLPTYTGFITKDGNTTASPGFTIQSNNTNPYLGIRIDTNLATNQSVYMKSTDNVFDGNWHYLVFVLNSGSVAIYKDGSLDSTGSYSAGTGFCNSALPLKMGLGQNISGTYDDIAMWTTALPGTAIATIYQHELTAHAGTLTSRVMDGLSSNGWTSLAVTTTLPFGKELPDTLTSVSPSPSPSPVSESHSSYSSLSSSQALMQGIVGLWHLDETSGTTVYDHSGNGNNGTIQSGVSLGMSGKFGNAASFSGSNSSYISIGSILTPTAYTKSAWIFTSNLTNNCNNILSGTVASGTALWAPGGGSCSTNYSNKLTASNSGSAPTVRDAVPLLANTWYHVAVTYDSTVGGGTLTLYKNGLNVGTATSVAAPTSSGLQISGFNGALYTLTGNIDEVGLWNRALSTTEILELYRRGANRIRYQVRSCADSTCSTNPVWLGPDGSNQTYFSELNNNAIPKDGADLTASNSVNAASPTFTFSNFVTASPAPTPFSVPNHQYFQYRAILESDDASTSCNYGGIYTSTWCSPELKSVVAGPTHYDNTNPTITNTIGVSYATLTTTFTPTASCSSNALYNLSPDGTHWYWYTAGAWAAADGTNTKATLGLNIDSTALTAFTHQYGAGNIYFKVFLQSGTLGTNSCSIDNLDLGTTR